MTENQLHQIVAIAIKAGHAIMEIYADPKFSVMAKVDASPLTAADLASEKIIQAGLADLALGWPELSEEATHPDYSVRSQY